VDSTAGVAVDLAMSTASKDELAAAQGGDPDAMFAMGVATEVGRGYERNLVHAYYWFSLAAAHGHAAARDQLYRIEPRLSESQIELAQGWTRAFLEERR
jgi:TPR repeat protein